MHQKYDWNLDTDIYEFSNCYHCSKQIYMVVNKQNNSNIKLSSICKYKNINYDLNVDHHYSDMVNNTGFQVCNDESHVFCIPCLRKIFTREYILTQTYKTRNHITCPVQSCNGQLYWDYFLSILPFKTLITWRNEYNDYDFKKIIIHGYLWNPYSYEEQLGYLLNCTIPHVKCKICNTWMDHCDEPLIHHCGQEICNICGYSAKHIPSRHFRIRHDVSIDCHVNACSLQAHAQHASMFHTLRRIIQLYYVIREIVKRNPPTCPFYASTLWKQANTVIQQNFHLIAVSGIFHWHSVY